MQPATTEPNENDTFVGPKRHSISLPAFEGPLDLLLYLVRKHEVDVYDIPIHDVTRQYLAILFDMQRFNLEIAGEFFVMAATLMQIKSAMLLPRDEALPEDEETEEGQDPRWQLIQQLIEYQKYKEAAGNLEACIVSQQDYIPRHWAPKAAPENAKIEDSDKIELWNTFNNVLRRLADKIVGDGEIHDENVSVSDRMEYILDRLKNEDSFLFSALFENESYTLSHIVASFLAILELCRLKELCITQSRSFADITVSKLKDEEHPDEDELDASSPDQAPIE